MRELKGLFIEDEVANIDIYTKLFALEGLHLECINELPATLEGFYDIVLKRDVDFLIIDYYLDKQWVKDSLDISEAYSKPGANHDAYNAIGYGYQWWVPEGNQGEFMAIGVYGQWIYVNPSKQIIIVKTSADPNFMEKGYELKHVAFFRAVANEIV